MENETADLARARRRRNITIIVSLCVMIPIMYFVLPRAFDLGRHSIMTPAEAAR